MIIESGTGNGKSVAVTEDNYLRVSSRVLSIEQHTILDGNAYNINTGDITLTSANESALLYLKNTGTQDWGNLGAIFLLGNSNVSGEDWVVKTYRNPTAGTLISSGTALEAFNRNFGSAKTLTGTVLSGLEGRTITASDGVAIQTRSPTNGRLVIAVGVLIPPGASVALSVEPPTGNTSVVVQCAFPILELEADHI